MPSRFTQYGGAFGAEQALRQMIADRLQAEAEAYKRALEQYKLQQTDRGLDLEGRRVDEGTRQFDLSQVFNREKFGHDVKEFEAGAPQREAQTGYLRTQTQDLAQRPIRDADARAQGGLLAERSHLNRLAEIGAQGDQQARVAGIRSTNSTNEPKNEGPSSYAVETATRTLTAVDDLLGKRQQDGRRTGGRINAFTAGPGGSLLSNIGGTPAADVSADLASVASNVAFNALQAMREASKTGGALGNVSDTEIGLLSSVMGSIRQNQSPANLRRNLEKIYDSQERFLAAARKVQTPGGRFPAGQSDGRGGIRVLSIEEVP